MAHRMAGCCRELSLRSIDFVNTPSEEHQKRLFRIAAVTFLLLSLCPPAFAQSVPENFIFFNLDRELMRKFDFMGMKQISGAQIKYTWRTLEPEKNRYDFSQIESDLEFLAGIGKKLFAQIQDVSFYSNIINVPDYVLKDVEYHGGADSQYEFSDDNDNNPKAAGWVARRWDPVVADRFHKLLAELGRRFDGRIAGVTLPETSVDFGSTGKYFPKGFSPGVYRDAIIANMKAANSAFKKATIIQYANFMPGEWLPWDEKGYLASIFECAKDLRIGIGGPDLIPNRKGQMNHSYYFAVKYQGKVTLGYAVQESNYAQVNAKTGKKLTVFEIYDFAANYLKTDYLFWFPQEPYFSRDVIPFLRKVGTGP